MSVPLLLDHAGYPIEPVPQAELDAEEELQAWLSTVESVVEVANDLMTLHAPGFAFDGTAHPIMAIPTKTSLVQIEVWPAPSETRPARWFARLLLKEPMAMTKMGLSVPHQNPDRGSCLNGLTDQYIDTARDAYVYEFVVHVAHWPGKQVKRNG